MAAPVMGDDAVAADKIEHLGIPIVALSGHPWWKTMGWAFLGPSPCRRFPRRPWW